MDDDDPLSDWGLRSVELADQPTIMPFFECLDEPLSDYTFSQIYTWRNSLRILWTTLHDHLCIFANGSGDLTLLMPPIGQGGGSADHALRAAFELMDDYNAGHGVPDHSRVEYASQELIDRLDRRGMLLQPMGADYVYDINRMIDLAGGDLSSKRQAKNRFLRNYRYRVEGYDAGRHLEECRRLLDTWKIHQDASHLDELNSNAIKRQKESIATDLTLQFASQLRMKGMVVYVGDNEAADADLSIRAFTFGELLGKNQSSITIEKTALDVKGLAQFIFSEFSRNWQDRPLVNVGDDWGLESLAWTKMSYRPVKMLQKFLVRKEAVVKVAVPAQMKGETIALDEIPQASTTAVRIRPAAKDDLAEIADLEKACFSSYSLNKRQLQYLQQRDTAVFLVSTNNEIVSGEGIALVRQHKRGLSGRIYSLAVRQEFRGHGVGLLLLEAMIGELATRGVKRVYLEVEQSNTPAIGLYERSGFATIGLLPDYYSQGKPAIHMMRRISAEPMLFDEMGEALEGSRSRAVSS
ncbi:MAG: GNAT family N-acetyltransferase [Planctomycetota bacterium]|nr:GNAT family N-acetyltransferase [Planctomycetota bacterium]